MEWFVDDSTVTMESECMAHMELGLFGVLVTCEPYTHSPSLQSFTKPSHTSYPSNTEIPSISH